MQTQSEDLPLESARPEAEERPQSGPIVSFVKRHPYAIAFVIGVIFLTAIRPFLRHVPEPPPPIGELPAFTLIAQDGREFSDKDLAGQVWVASFIFTSCPTVCPKVTGAMAELQRRFEEDDVPVHLVTVTVDPENDTPQVLRQYALVHGAQFDRWTFLTGPMKDIEALVVGGFRAHLGDKAVDSLGVIDIAHTTKLVLVDGKGRIRGYYSSDSEGVDEVFYRAQHVLRQRREEGS